MDTADAEPHYFADSPAIGPIVRDRKGWLQQTPSHSRNRIRQRRCLPLFRYPTFGASRSDVGGIQSALLRFQNQDALSFGFGSTAAKGITIDAAEVTLWLKKAGVSDSMK